MGIVDKILTEAGDRSEYLRWKRKNVTIRGIREAGQDNGSGASLGEGLYTAPLSNKELARQYGQVHFVVNAIPKNPLVVDSINRWELWLQDLMFNKLGFSRREEFFKTTNVREEVMKLGYDGVIIKGREMVNYTPENVVYFKDEQQLYNYWEFMYNN